MLITAFKYSTPKCHQELYNEVRFLIPASWDLKRDPSDYIAMS